MSDSFSIEALAVFPPPGMALPNHCTFSADDGQVRYLAGTSDDPTQRLCVLDIASGGVTVQATAPDGGTQEATLTPEEELRRQRERMLNVGITSYSVHDVSGRILLPIAGDLYVLDAPNTPLRHLVAGPASDATWSPDGRSIAFTRAGEVWVVPTEGGEPRQVTSGRRADGITRGSAEYIAQEELGRREGYWWSPDSQYIAFAEVDERHIPRYRIVHQGSDDPAVDETHRYPFAGAANARVRLGLVRAAGSAVGWLAHLGSIKDGYLAHVFWWPNGDLGAEVLDRPQKRLDVFRCTIEKELHTRLATREMHPAPRMNAYQWLIREENAHWVTMRTRHRLILSDETIVWASERGGFNHLYVYGRRGTSQPRQLTTGDWVVDGIAGVDEARGIVYFMGNRERATETHLYAVPLAGGDVRRVTTRDGTHTITIDHRCETYIDTYHALDQPPTITLRSLADDTLICAIPVPDDPRVTTFGLTPPQIVSLTNREGMTLYGAVYQPDPAMHGPGPYPTIIDVYGGPGPQAVTNGWGLTASLRAQYLRDLGYLVFKLDNRGSARRGLAFESGLAGRMGTIEVDDQVDGVNWLVSQGLADPARVGVIGWSYGGYMALMCLAKAPQVFRVAVAGAPVISWDGYDTAYTERYMGTPEANASGYAEGDVLRFVEGIQGKLLLIHGMLDENVHFRHTARLINALTRARKPYDALIFPDERHMPRRQADRVYLHERTIAFFQAYL